MAHDTPQVRNGVLTIIQARDGSDAIAVESGAWWRWLNDEGATTFHFSNQQESFTARRERKSGGWYWYAYRRHQGKLHKAYLGKSEELYQARLDTTATLLAKQFQHHDQHDHNGHIPAPASNHSNTLPSAPWIGEPLLTTKLYHPVERAERVARPHLLKRLDRSQRCKLTLISAPAGFGKTTLLAEWLAGSQAPCAWLSLDRSDNDPTRFWTYVLAALETRCPGLGEQVQPLLQPPPWPPIEAVLTVVINALTASGHGCVLVLDDYHLITEPTIHAGLTFLIDHLPPHIHLMLLSRSDPPLPLMSLRVKGQLVELRAADLRFSFEEATTFFRQVMGLELTHEEIASLDEHTEGWVAGLQLAGLSMQGHSQLREVIAAFTGSHHYILSYLTGEVLHGLPDEVRDFLLDTAILERLSAPLCNAVTGRDDAQARLEHLERANLFLVPLDEQRHWYRYHHLFAEFLRDRLREEHPERIPLLHSRASAWFEQHAWINEAVDHALATGDMEQAAQLAESWAQLVMMRGESATFLHWIELLPEHVIRHHPYLILYHIASLISIGRLDEAEAQLADAEELRKEERFAVNEDLRMIFLAVRASLAAFQGNLQLAEELSQQTLANMSSENPYVRSIIAAVMGNVYLLTGELTKADEAFVEAIATGMIVQNRHVVLASMSAQGYLQAAHGHLRQAMETQKQAIRLGFDQGGKLFPGVSMCYGFASEIFCEWHELEEAERYARQALEIGKQWGYLGMLGQAHSALAHIHMIRGQKDEALALIRRGEELICQSNLTRLTSMIVSYRAWIQLKSGDSEGAAQWARTCGFSEHDTFTYPQELVHVILIEVLMATGRSDEAGRILSRLLPVAEAGGRVHTTIMCLVMQALLLQSQGRLEAATDTLARALLYGESDGYVHSIIDYGRPVISLLRHAAARGIAPAYVRKLLNAASEHANTFALYPISSASLLSERELHVLQRIAAGRSNQEIAQDLIVAQSTIKTHINNIYAKLSVHSRTGAIAQAKTLGLL